MIASLEWCVFSWYQAPSDVQSDEAFGLTEAVTVPTICRAWKKTIWLVVRVHLPVGWLPLSSTMSIRFLSTDHDHKGTTSTSLTSNVGVCLSADRECLDRLHTDSAGFCLWVQIATSFQRLFLKCCGVSPPRLHRSNA